MSGNHPPLPAFHNAMPESRRNISSRDRGLAHGFQLLFASSGNWRSSPAACGEKDGGRVLTLGKEWPVRWLVAPPVGVNRVHAECLPRGCHPELLSNLDAAASQGEAPLLPHLAPLHDLGPACCGLPAGSRLLVHTTCTPLPPWSWPTGWLSRPGTPPWSQVSASPEA